MNPNRLTIELVALMVGLTATGPVGVRAEDVTQAPREVPAKSIPVPADVSPGMQKLIAAPLNPAWHDLWKTGEEWRKAAEKRNAEILPTIPAMTERLHVKIEPSTIDGVKVFIVTPTRFHLKIATGCCFTSMVGATLSSPARRARPRRSQWLVWSISK
jgi:threonine synthase